MRPAIAVAVAVVVCGGFLSFVSHVTARAVPAPARPVPVVFASRPELPASDATTSLALILDTSGSMDDVVSGGETKLQCAKHVLEEDFLPLLAEDVHVALYRFDDGVSVELAPLRRNGSFDAPGWTHRELLMEQVDRTVAKGKTPIAASLRQAFGALEGVRGRRMIVLVTDGEESFEGKDGVLEELRQIRAAGVERCVVGFDIGDEGKYIAQELGTGRAYFEANGGRAALLEVMNGILAQIEK